MAPPKWAVKFLKWYCHDDLLEEIEGDVYELFYTRVEEEGLKKAKLKFVWDVLRFFRFSNMSNQFIQNSNNIGMLKNYFKVGIRNIRRNKLTSAINIVGLSLAIGFALTNYAFLNLQYNSDKFHVNHERIFMVEHEINEKSGPQLWADAPNAFGPAAKSEFESVESFTRLQGASAIVKYQKNVFRETAYYVDPAFLDIFSFEMASKIPGALSEPSHVVLSHDIALKYFGESDPIGQEITIVLKDKSGAESKELFTVTGVANPFNKIRSFAFDILLPYDKMRLLGYENLDGDWSSNPWATFILADSKNSFDDLQDKVQQYVTVQNEANPARASTRYILEPVTTLAQNSYLVRGSISVGGHGSGRMIMVIIAMFLLVLACFNYMNIALSSATSRLKEIGVRKTMGGQRSQLVFQFLTENILLCLLALIGGFLISIYVLLPVFNDMMPIELSLDLDSDPRIWLFFGGVILFTALLSGAYPAFYISRFKPARIFQGKGQLRGSSFLSKAILTFQYSIALLTIGFCATLIANSNYMQSKDWGYNKDDIIVVPTGDSYLKYKNAAAQYPSILNSGGALNPIGVSDPATTVKHGEVEATADMIKIGEDYLEAMNVKISEGRLFDKDKSSDYQEAVIVNTTFLHDFEIDDAIGYSFEIDGETHYIIGVVDDFHFDELFFQIKPLMVKLIKEEENRYFVAHVEAGNLNSTMEHLRKIWNEVEPDLPFEGSFQSQYFQGFTDEMASEAKIGGIIGSFALIISCVGLFGITSLSISKRMKEFSIRKVLGATMFQVSTIINKEVLTILIISLVIATPLSYLASKAAIEGIFFYHVPITLVPTIIASVILVLTSLLTISSKIWDVMTSNPVDSLRSE